MKIKKLAAILLSGVTLLCFSGCSKNEGEVQIPYGMELLTNENIDYNFFYPKDWIVDRNDGMVRVHVSDSDAANVSVTTYAFPSGYDTLKDYCDNFYKEKILATYKEATFDEEYSETEMLGTNNALSTHYSITVDGVTYKFYQVVAYSGGYVFNLTYCASEDSYDLYLEQAESIIENISLK